MKILKITVALILTVFISNVYATSIVILVGKNYVYIGADSKAIGNNNFEAFVDKIVKTNRYLFATSGYVQHEPSGYVPSKNINQYLKYCKDFDSIKQEKLNLILKSIILKELKNLRKNPKAPRYFPKENFNVFQYCVIGFKNGFPFAYISKFFLKDTSKDAIKVISGYSTRDDIVFTLGEDAAIGNFLSRGTDIPHNQVDFINKLIGMEVTAKPQTVGGRIRIIAALKDKFTDIQ